MAELPQGGYVSVYYYISHTLATESSEEMPSLSIWTSSASPPRPPFVVLSKEKTAIVNAEKSPVWNEDTG